MARPKAVLLHDAVDLGSAMAASPGCAPAPTSWTLADAKQHATVVSVKLIRSLLCQGRSAMAVVLQGQPMGALRCFVDCYGTAKTQLLAPDM